jgi:hypothetical protein
LDWLDVFLELKRTIEDQLEEPEIKQLLEDINNKVFGTTRIARIAPREEVAEPETRGDSEVAKMKERMAKRRAEALRGEQSKGMYLIPPLLDVFSCLCSTCSFTLVEAEAVEESQE